MPAALFASALLPACGGFGSYRARISSDDMNERILGVRQAGEQKDWSAVPLIVDRLEDEDEGVRFYAILALERITGERFGYDYSKPGSERAESVQRWRQFVRRGEHMTAARRAAEDAGDETDKDGDPDA